MDKKSVDMKIDDNRSELVGKVEIKEGVKKKTTKKKEVKDDLEQTIALDTVEILRKGNVKKHSEEEKRSEIVGKFYSDKKENDNRNNVKEATNKNRKTKVDTTSMRETSDDKIQENVENVSVAMIVLIILFCFVVGIILGYLLYKLAINNSSGLSFILNNYFNI